MQEVRKRRKRSLKEGRRIMIEERGWKEEGKKKNNERSKRKGERKRINKEE
jgi:hypothetical protein